MKRSETTRKLKALFHEKEGTPENLQELFFSGKQLKDDHKLVDHGIWSNCTLHLYLQDIDKIKLLVYLPSNKKTLELEAKTRDTPENIKFLIQTKEGILSEQFTLFYGGELLDHNRTLASLGIQSESMLYLVLNPRDVVSIFVKMQSGEILKLEVKVWHTVQDLKAIVQSIVGFVARAEDLTYAGKLLEDSKTLACYNIKENSLLEMLPLNFTIFLKNLSDKTLVLKVCTEDWVFDVKKNISDEEGFPVRDIRLIFARRTLEDDRDLASYNVEKDSILHWILQLHG